MSIRQSITSALVRVGLPLAILAVGVAVYAAFGRKPALTPRAETKPSAPLVETVLVAAHSGGLELEVDGNVVPHRQIGLAAEVEGRVTFKSPDCRAGRYVKQGTLLLEIDRRDRELEVERLNQELAQAAVSIAELDVEIESAASMIELAEEECALQQRQLKRAKDVYQKGATTDSTLDEARRGELTARNNLRSLTNQQKMLQTRHARLEQAKKLVAARLAQAELDLERTRVTAPVAGVIVDDAVEQGDYVQRGALLAEFEDTSAVEVKCAFRVEELDWLRQHAAPAESAGDDAGPESDYELPNIPVAVVYRLRGRDYVWDGVLARYDGIGLDEKTRTAPCRVLVADPRGVRCDERDDARGKTTGPRALTRGMFVHVRAVGRGDRTMLRLPQRGVQPGNVVWRVRDGRLDIVPVEVAGSEGDDVLVDNVLLAGEGASLRAGDRIVVSPLATAVAGMPVREAPRP